jgi:hypothetical protein
MKGNSNEVAQGENRDLGRDAWNDSIRSNAVLSSTAA